MSVPEKSKARALPEYQGGSVYAPGLGSGARLSGEGGRAAAAAAKAAYQADPALQLGKLAQAANNAIQTGIKAYEDYQGAKAQEAFNHYQQEEAKLRAELNTLEGANALGEEGVEARLKKWRSESRASFGGNLGEIAKKLFERHADKLDAGTDAWAIGKVNKENIAWQNSVSEGSILNARNAALEGGDDASLANAMGIMAAEYEKMGARSGWDASYREAKLKDAQKKLLGEMIGNAVEGERLSQAQGLLARHGAALGGKADIFKARIAAKGRELESRAQAQHERQVRKEASNFLAETADLSGAERIKLAQDQYADPKQRELLTAILNGIYTQEAAREKVQAQAKKVQFNAVIDKAAKVAASAELSPEQKYEALLQLREDLPLEMHEKYARQAQNLLNPGRFDDDAAVDEVGERIANGEELNVRAEYGHRLSPQTLDKLTSKAWRENLPQIRTAFKEAAQEWLGDVKNKNAAKEFGFGSTAALWNSFLAQTDADEKRDYARLRKEANDFFKKVKLSQKGLLFNSSVDTIGGLADAWRAGHWKMASISIRLKEQRAIRLHMSFSRRNILSAIHSAPRSWPKPGGQ